MEFRILGPLSVRNEGNTVRLGGPQPQKLLAALLSNPNRALSAGRLAQELWGEDAPRTATTAVQVHVSRLRRVLGDRIETSPAGYRLRVEPGELDVEHFARTAEDGKKAMAAGAPERAARLLREALEMWQGEPFDGLALGPIAQAEADRMVENRRAARAARVGAELDAGRHHDMVGELSGELASDPTDEALAASLMLALYRCDRQDDALAVYRRVSKALFELGLSPGPALRDMEQRILRQDPTLDPREPVAAPGRPRPLPPVLRAVPPTRVPVVGRESEMAQLSGVIAEVAAGARRVVLIEGEAGVGKTRLAIEAALSAHEKGFAVGWGAAAEGLSAPYGVWHDALSHLARHMSDQRAAEHLTAYGNTISHLLPWFDRRSAPSIEATSSTTAAVLSKRGQEPDLLFAAVAGLLRTLCADQPVALVLDDVQWANPQSLRLLRYVAGDTPDLPLLVIATCRDRDRPDAYSVGALHADLRRLPDAEPADDLIESEGPVLSLEVEPLDRPQVRELINALARHDVGPGGRTLTDALAEETGGNPFFVRELLRHLRSSEAVEQDHEGHWRLVRPISELPRSVHEVVEQRVHELGAEVPAVLSAASVIGRNFDAGLLARVVELSDGPIDELGEHQIGDALAAARRGHVVAELDTPPKHYSFEHACFQHSLYDKLVETKRARYHVAVATALEEAGRGDPFERAHHWVTADVREHADQAVHYARRAGERALEQLAPDDAVRWFEAARDRVGDDEAERCDILTRLGVAKRQLGSDFGETLGEASELAEKLGDHRRLARAVIANSAGPFGAAGHADEARVGWLRRALAELPDDDPEVPLIRAVLGKELYYGGEPKGAAECRRAVEEARDRYSPSAPTRAKRDLAGVLAYAMAITPLTPPRQHAKLSAELAQLAEELDDRELRFEVASTRFMRGMYVGDPYELDEGLREMEKVAPSGAPILRWTTLWSASARRLVGGDLDGAEEMADEAAAFARPRGVENGEVVAFGQRMGIAAERGTLSEMEEDAERLAREHPTLPLLQLAGPFIAAETRQRDAAARFAEVVGHEYDFRYPQTRAACLARCAEIALRLGESDRYARLSALLERHRGQFATPSAITSRGSIDLSLARLAAALGQDEKAEEHFTAAEHAHARLGAPLMGARTELARGEALLDREPERAVEHLSSARTLAKKHGGMATVEEADELLKRATEQGCELPSSALLS